MTHSGLYGGAILLACGMGFVSVLAFLSYAKPPTSGLSPIFYFGLETDFTLMGGATILFLASIWSTRSPKLKTQLTTTETNAGSDVKQSPTPEFHGASTNPVESGSKGELSLLELTILQELRRGKNKSDEELSSITGVDKSIISAKLDKLYKQDYTTREGRLTEKSFNLLHESSQSPGSTKVGEPSDELDELTKMKARLYDLEQLKQSGKIGETAYEKLKKEYEKKISQADKGTQVY